MVKNTDKAWLAGIVDGEGCITGCYTMKTDKSRHHTGKTWTYPSFTFSISISNNRKSILNEVMRITGITQTLGEVLYEKSGNTNYKWSIAGNDDILKVLDLIEPYLVGKKENASVMRTAINLRKNKKHKYGKDDDDKREKLLKYVCDLQDLNQNITES